MYSSKQAVKSQSCENGKQVLYFFVLSVRMGRIEFPATPINVAAKNGTSPVKQNGFVQLALEGLELEQTPEIELGNCIVTVAVRFRKLVSGNEWRCRIHAEPDLLHPEQEGAFEAYAYNHFADMAQSYHLRPGDRAILRGTMHTQTIELENGEKTSVNHFFVTAIEVVARSKRTSITAYEKAKR